MRMPIIHSATATVTYGIGDLSERRQDRDIPASNLACFASASGVGLSLRRSGIERVHGMARFTGSSVNGTCRGDQPIL
jgi:hypothetical protein